MLSENSTDAPQEISKATRANCAWFATIGGRPSFVKWYPLNLRASWVATETAIAGAELYLTIIFLRHRVDVADGTLLIYDRADGENLGPQEIRHRFQALLVTERIGAVLTVVDVLAADRRFALSACLASSLRETLFCVFRPFTLYLYIYTMSRFVMDL